MKAFPFWLWLLACAAILGMFSFALVLSGQTNETIFPSSLSSEPGGIGALYELLEREGVPVERIYYPSAKRNDIGLAFYFSGLQLPFSPDDELLNSDTLSTDSENIQPDTWIVVQFSPFAKKVNKKTNSQPFLTTSNFPALSSIREVSITHLSPIDRNSTTSLLETRDSAIFSFYSEPTNFVVYCHFGEMLLNRFIGESQNADAIVAIIKSFLPKGKIVAFPEYRLGIRPAGGVLARLGPAFTSAGVQVLFLLIMIIYTFGKRFGYPEIDPITTPSASEFVSAMAESYRRSESTDIVLHNFLLSAVRQASQKYSLASDLTIAEKIRCIPGPLGKTLKEVERMKEKKVPPKTALAYVQLIEKQITELLGPKHA